MNLATSDKLVQSLRFNVQRSTQAEHSPQKILPKALLIGRSPVEMQLRCVEMPSALRCNGVALRCPTDVEELRSNVEIDLRTVEMPAAFKVQS